MDFAQLIATDKQLLLSLNGSDSLFLDGLVKTLTTASTWVPLYIALFCMVMKNNDKFWKVLLVLAGAGFCLLVAGSVDDLLVKPGVARWRPSQDDEIGWLVDIVNGYRGGKYGFFSAHASNTFSIAIFFTLLIRSRALSVALILWSLLNCWTRLYLGVHYPGDILCGLLWGGFTGTMAWFLWRWIILRIEVNDNIFISSQYTVTGYQHSDVDMVITVLVFTLFYAVLRACYFLYV